MNNSKDTEEKEETKVEKVERDWISDLLDIAKSISITQKTVLESRENFKFRKLEYDHKENIEHINTERTKQNHTVFIIMVCLIIISVSLFLFKDVPPVLNTLISFIIGLTVKGFMPNKDKKE